jgi:hypothetical protein
MQMKQIKFVGPIKSIQIVVVWIITPCIDVVGY